MGAPGPDLTVVGFAVAGGRSTRMGRDKATLPWNTGDLLDHTIARLSAVTDDVRILGGPDGLYADRGAMLPDAVTDVGAVAALVTALRALPPDGVALVLAIDLPLVTPDLLRALLAMSAGFDAVVPVSPRGAEPFCAVYGHACLEAVLRAVSDGRFKMTAFWPDVRVREVAAGELSAFGDPGRLFANVNTAEDYRRARETGGG